MQGSDIMTKIAQGINVFVYNNLYVVFFADKKYRYYQFGELLFELISNDALYLITEKVENMIKCFSDKDKPLSKESITEGFKWLYGTVEDEELPVATEIFRSSFNEILSDNLCGQECSVAWANTEEFFISCYNEYMQNIKGFSLYTDSLIKAASNIADEFETSVAKDFIELSEEHYDSYTRKCGNRKNDGGRTLDTIHITAPI